MVDFFKEIYIMIVIRKVIIYCYSFLKKIYNNNEIFGYEIICIKFLLIKRLI